MCALCVYKSMYAQPLFPCSSPSVSDLSVSVCCQLLQLRPTLCSFHSQSQRLNNAECFFTAWVFLILLWLLSVCVFLWLLCVCLWVFDCNGCVQFPRSPPAAAAAGYKSAEARDLQTSFEWKVVSSTQQRGNVPVIFFLEGVPFDWSACALCTRSWGRRRIRTGANSPAVDNSQLQQECRNEISKFVKKWSASFTKSEMTQLLVLMSADWSACALCTRSWGRRRRRTGANSPAVDNSQLQQECRNGISEEVKCKFYQIWDDIVVSSYERWLKRMCTVQQEKGEEEENRV